MRLFIVLAVFSSFNHAYASPAHGVLSPIYSLLLQDESKGYVGELSYEDIISPYTGRTWLDRNLGATRVCNRIDDKECYGYYFQWGRGADGHQVKTSATTDELSNSSSPNHGRFILTVNLSESREYGDSKDRNWLSYWDTSLWSNNKNNPCPLGYRVPTSDEFMDEMAAGNITNNDEAFNSFMKIPAAGIRGDWIDFSSVYGEGFYNYYWTISSLTSSHGTVYANSTDLNLIGIFRAFGASVRCIKSTN